MKRQPKPKQSALLDIVIAQLDDAKAEQVVTIDLDGKTAIADSMVVATGRSTRHVGAIAEQLIQKLKGAGHRDLRVEGFPNCDWVLVDAGDVVVHLFRPEVRSFYNLEKLWSEHAPQERIAVQDVRISVAAVGRLKTGAEKSLAADYFERTQGLCRKAGITKVTITELQESRAAETKLRLADEAAALASAVSPQAFRIVLDERGKAMTSEAFTDLIRKRQQEGTADLAFLIGGPDGHSPQIRDSANLLMAFGPATWPHRLVRIMLLEQIYRAVTIMVNHPYHRP